MRKMWAGRIIGAAILGGAALSFATGIAARAESAAPGATEDLVLGKADAPITIIEYASLTCPHCAAFEAETLPKVQKDWIDTGKAKLIFRDFPFDNSAFKASVLARCAAPERFYGFIDMLFKSQANWGHAADPAAALGRIGKLGGVTEEKYKSCQDDKALTDGILAGRLYAEQTLKVESTPTFFINGRKVLGNLPYEKFEEALKGGQPK